MSLLRAVEVPIEIAHHSITGAIHGHTLMLTVWTRDAVDLDQWRADVAEAVAYMENGFLEDRVGRTFEDVALAVLDRVEAAERVQVRLPSRGHIIEARR
jgi:hypothetical protein